ncbi:MAG: sigma-70 family RNA polymerase sigma factor [Acidobacteriaceae bacterium]
MPRGRRDISPKVLRAPNCAGGPVFNPSFTRYSDIAPQGNAGIKDSQNRIIDCETSFGRCAIHFPKFAIPFYRACAMKVVEDFDDVYSCYAGDVYRLCLRAVSRPEVAEDLTSDVFLLFHENRHKLTAEQLPGWLFTVAKRRAADYWRRHYVEQRWNATQPEQISSGTDPEFSIEVLLERCEALKPAHRTCLILRFRHGMSRTEIATHLGLSELQVKGHLQYGLRLLRDHMERPEQTSHATASNLQREIQEMRKENEALDG